MPAPPPPRTPPPPPAPRPRNARATRKAPHGVLEVDWPFFGEMCRALALKIFRDYDPDVVIGIARAARLVTGRRVLIVDETCDTGATMKLALNAVRELKPAAVKTAVSFRTGEFKPDFYALETDNFVILPWDREVIIDGEIVMRPDYAAKLKELGG